MRKLHYRTRTIRPRIRTGLIALSIAFALAFGLGPVDELLGMSLTPSAHAGNGGIKKGP